jgi:ribonucleoside-diphosphate reductase alpha chain
VYRWAQIDDTTDGGAVDAGAATDALGANGAGPAAQDDTIGADDSTQDLIAAGESPECPECGRMNLYYSKGCKTCESCGWSEC